MSKPDLKKMLRDKEFIVAPGVQDMMAALMAKKVGFDVVYVSGYWTAASAFGLPDSGIVTFSQMVDRLRIFSATTDAAIIADADTGFGGLINVHHMVKGYESAGVTGIQIEDQVFPKMCGHRKGRGLVSVEEMEQKIQVACEARDKPDETLIIARTDARLDLGFPEAMARAERYAEAGADMLFVEALQSEDEMRIACADLPLPQVVNMANGGVTPIKTNKELAALGFGMAIWPAMNSLAALNAMQIAMQTLMQHGTTEHPDLQLFSFEECCNMLGFDDIEALEEKWEGFKKKG